MEAASPILLYLLFMFKIFLQVKKPWKSTNLKKMQNILAYTGFIAQ